MQTKEECQAHINNRMPIVCSFCGGKIEPIETVDNSNDHTFWPGCNDCMKFNNGTSPKIYDVATRLVDEEHFRAYHFEKMPDKEKDPLGFDYWRKGQINGTVGVVADILKLLGEIEEVKKGE